jgi:hypothetical protein
LLRRMARSTRRKTTRSKTACASITAAVTCRKQLRQCLEDTRRSSSLTRWHLPQSHSAGLTIRPSAIQILDLCVLPTPTQKYLALSTAAC